MCNIDTMLLCEKGGTIPWAGREWFDMLFNWSKDGWLNDKTIIELGLAKNIVICHCLAVQLLLWAVYLKTTGCPD